MQRIVNFMSGNIRVEVEAPYPERFMNLCAQNDIAFWDLERVSEVTVRVTMTIASYRRLKPLMGGLGAEIRQVRRSGAPVFLWRIRRRYALLVGLVLTLVAIWVMSLYIWDIQVTGNDRVSTAEILQALEEVGVSTGTFGPSIDPEALRNEVLLLLDDLSWITVNVNGSRATVIVREREPKPEMIPEDVPTAVYATKSGIIESMIVLDGMALYEIGDTVAMGEDLVTGRMDSIASGTRFVHADAEIYARTWYEFSMEMPLELSEKQYTGQSRTKRTIIFGKNRINLFFDSGISYTAYDKITKDTNLTLPGGIILPVRVLSDEYIEYDPVYSLLAEEEAEAVLQQRLLDKLEASMEENGEVLETTFETRVTDGVITVYMEAECREQIAAVRRLSEDEMLVVPGETEESGEETETT